MTAEGRTSPTRAPRRLALVLAWLTGALLVVGALVTTYRVGMAVTDWPTTFGYSMFAYPLGAMLEDFGVTVEHGHRMLASLVGLVSLALVLVTAARGARAVVAVTGLAAAAEVLLVLDVLRVGAVGGALQASLLAAVAGLLLLALVHPWRRGPRAIAAVIHLAIIGQGLLGGSRVLENSQQLAFLHGSAAQLVFLLVAMGVVITSPRYRSAEPAPGRGPVGLAALATGLVYAQVVLGAWLRHTGRATPLLMHLVFAFAAVGAALALARALRRAADEGSEAGHDRAPLRRLSAWILGLVAVQVLLGLASLAAIQLLSGGFTGPVTVTEAVTASAHVLAGALLLGSCAAAGLWSARLVAPRPAHHPAVAPALDGGVA